MARGALPSGSTPATFTVLPAQATGQLFVTILKWHRLILLFGFVLMLAAWASMWSQPVVASAVAKILIKTDRAVPISGLPTAGGRGGYSLEILRTEVEFFTSSAVLLPVAKALKGEQDEATEIPDRVARDTDFSDDVAALRNKLSVVAVPNASVIRATYVDSVATQAERVLGMIVNSYIKRDAAASRLWEFFERETQRAATGLREAEERLRSWQDANNITAVDNHIAAQLASVSDTEGAIRRIDAEIPAVKTQIETLTRDVAGLPAQAVTSRTQVANPLAAKLRADLAAEESAGAGTRRNPIADRLRSDIAVAEAATLDTSTNPLVLKFRTDLAAAESALHDVRQRYTDQDRRVQEKMEQVKRLQEELAAAERDTAATARERLQGLRRELATVERDADAAARTALATLRTQLADAEREATVLGGETLAPHPLRESLTRELAAARPRLTSLVSQRETLRVQLAATSALLAPLREHRVHFERLSRDVELAKSNYLQNTKRLEDSRVAASLEKDQFSNVSVIEPPVATMARRGKAGMMELTLLAGLVGIGLGMATAFALEFFNRSVRTAEDVEFYLGVPVIATVPALPEARRVPALPASTSREMVR